VLSRWLRRERPDAEPAQGARRRGLLDVDLFLVGGQVLEFTVDRLAERGRQGLEAFVVWGGRRLSGGRIHVSSAIYPEQVAYETEDGLLVVVEDDSLFEVNRSLNERGEVLAAQVHTHPTDAYHSSTDDAMPIVTIVGGLSVVIPDFARGATASQRRWAWYRLSARAEWEPPPRRVQVGFV